MTRQEGLLFLKKKKQKDFRSVRPRSGGTAGATPGTHVKKVFWFFFSKKNVLLPGLLALSGCLAESDPTFAPACPKVAVLKQAATLTRYVGDSRDLRDLVLDARIDSLKGSCGNAENHKLKVQATIALDVTRGPAMAGRSVDLPVFVVLAHGDDIWDKQITNQRVTFPSNVDEVKLETKPVRLKLPTPRGVKGSDYQIWVGYQKTTTEQATAPPVR